MNDNYLLAITIILGIIGLELAFICLVIGFCVGTVGEAVMYIYRHFKSRYHSSNPVLDNVDSRFQ